MRRLFLKLFRRRKLEADLEAEMAFHREMADFHQTPIPFGNVSVLKEEAFDQWRFNFIENLWRDLVYAARSLRRSRGFLLSALLSLGLGIGVNTAIFSVAVEFLMSRPSVTDPARVVSIRLGGNSHARPEALQLLRNSGLFQDVAGENMETSVNWNNGQETLPVYAVQTSKNYFSTLGIPLAYGRGWSANDSDEVIVLSNRFWRRHFGQDASVVGRPMTLDGRLYTVLGILPESHRTLVGFGFSPDVYLPCVLKDTFLQIYARLKPGMPLGEARAALRVVAERIDRELPESWKYASEIEMYPLVSTAGIREAGVTIAAFFGVLLLLAFLVLLIACINVAGLLLVRASVRRQEIATRLSLGASRGRLLQQLLSESLLLSILGVVAGFVLAQVVAKGLVRIHLPLPFPVQLQIEPDWRVGLYAAFLGVVATVACGLLPAWQAAKESLAARMHRESRRRLGRGLVTAQIAVSVIVLAIGALFLRNLLLANAMSPGFDVRRTLRADVHLPPAAYRDKQRLDAYFNAGLRELTALPGVEAAAAARIVPFTDSTTISTEVTFTATGKKQRVRYHWNAISPGYFRAMDIAVLAGRPFNDRDKDSTKVVIVNRAFMNQCLDGVRSVGAAFVSGKQKTTYQIVGVVADTKNMTIGEGDQPQLYEPLAQIPNDRPRIQFIVRSATPPALQLAAVRQALRRAEPAAGIEAETLYSTIGFAFLPSQVGAAFMGSIGILGLLLAAIGLYGVMAYAVARRTREIGIRIAIGAPLRAIAGMVVAESSKLLLIGSAIGLVIAVFLARPLTMFFVPGLSPGDPLAFAGVVLALLVTGVAAALGPVRRAIGVDPAVSLRDQ